MTHFAYTHDDDDDGDDDDKLFSLLFFLLFLLGFAACSSIASTFILFLYHVYRGPHDYQFILHSLMIAPLLPLVLPFSSPPPSSSYC